MYVKIPDLTTASVLTLYIEANTNPIAPIGVAESIKVVFASVKVISNNQTIKVNIIKKPNNF